MPKINQEEYWSLKGIVDDWKWIARDKNNYLFAYSSKPSKHGGGWGNRIFNDSVHLIPHDAFQFIQWEDPEPYNISELIEEYERTSLERKVKEVFEKNPYEPFIEFGTFRKESEETAEQAGERLSVVLKTMSKAWHEMMNKEEETEVKRDLKEAILGIEVTQFDGQKADLEELVNPKQLEEIINDWMPEVLSQELPVIPKFVADWFENNKDDLEFKVKTAIKYPKIYDEGVTEFDRWLSNPHNKPIQTLGNMFNGYEVEEEQKYVVPVGENHALCKFTDDVWGIYKEDSDKLYLDDDFKFTEQEIKDYEPNYWPFAKRVEDMEE